jgi:hypothetical protein
MGGRLDDGVAGDGWVAEGTDMGGRLDDGMPEDGA